MFGISLPGAVSNTLETPLALKCLLKATLSLKAPVLSITKAFLIP
jgi:hypothetical protein